MAEKHIKQCESCIHTRVCYLKANRKNYTGGLKISPCEHYRGENEEARISARKA